MYEASIFSGFLISIALLVSPIPADVFGAAFWGNLRGRGYGAAPYSRLMLEWEVWLGEYDWLMYVFLYVICLRAM